jgi:hypothetical protein
VLTVLTSGKAAPGTTTATWALAFGWPRPVLAVDCDPGGGDMAPGLLAGRVVTDRGLLSWSTTARRGTPALTAAAAFADHAVALPEREHVWLLPGFTTSTQARSFTTDTWDRLALALERARAALGRDVLVDAGRLAGERACWPVIRAADRVLVAVRPSVRSVHAAHDATGLLREELGDLSTVSALVIGDGDYRPTEIAAALDLPLAGTLPGDRTAAGVLSDGHRAGARALDRSALLRSATGLARHLATDVDHADTAADTGVVIR